MVSGEVSHKWTDAMRCDATEQNWIVVFCFFDSFLLCNYRLDSRGGSPFGPRAVNCVDGGKTIRYECGYECGYEYRYEDEYRYEYRYEYEYEYSYPRLIGHESNHREYRRSSKKQKEERVRVLVRVLYEYCASIVRRVRVRVLYFEHEYEYEHGLAEFIHF